METCRFILYLNLLMAAALFSCSDGLVVAGNVVLGHDMRVAGRNATATGGISIHSA